VDFRRALDEKSVDALVLGTPDHWHAIPTIHACQAGKDVYVEKPDGHNVLESQTMVAAQKKYGRVVQLGTNSRSAPFLQESIAWLREGHLGRVRFAKAWESARQGSIGYPADSEPPAGVDYDRWLGPAPKRPFNPRRFHGSWRWFFDYGTGDLGNDGVHRIDYALGGLKAAVEAQKEELPQFPKVVSALGGKNYFDDAQEWPDTLMTTCDFGGFVLTYEMRIWTGDPLHGYPEGAAVLGDRRYAVISQKGWRAFDAKGKQVFEKPGERNLDSTREHARNFVDCMRTRKKPAADLETVGQPVSLLCHVGNAAWRLGRSVSFDAKSHTFLNDPEANRHLTRPEYRKPWTLPTIEA